MDLENSVFLKNQNLIALFIAVNHLSSVGSEDKINDTETVYIEITSEK